VKVNNDREIQQILLNTNVLCGLLLITVSV